MKYINKFIIVLIVLFIIVFGGVFLFLPKDNLMIDLSDKSVEEIKKYAVDNKLNLKIIEEESVLEKGKFLRQSIKENTKLKNNDELIIYIAKPISYSKYKIDETGNIPIMMYHGIHNKESKYVGGNIDKDGYQRTTKAFINDLNFYYNSGYRMIKLKDYVNGIIDCELGKSPIILTFDDGLENNIKVTGLDENGNIIIDPNSAVGILEKFKKDHPDFNVTATFFINGGLFNQSKYNEKILKWLIENNYDIGNHSYTHANFSKINNNESIEEIGKMYNLLDKYIPGKYLNIVALPFGSPYSKEHSNYKNIIKGNYDGKEYNTISTLRVGWEAEYSPFNPKFDKMFLKRIRAYDNNGKDFDIEMNFKILEKNRYISDGNKEIITAPKDKKINNLYNLKIKIY